MRIVFSALLLLSVDNSTGANAFLCHCGTRSKVSSRQPLPNMHLDSVSGFDRYGKMLRHCRTTLCLVSEEDVLEAVERAETLWAEALEARTKANALIDQAEEEASASAGTAKKAENIFQGKTTPITMEELVQVDSAAKASLDATSLVNRAMEASDEAERLEAEAEEALKKSEETLDQHLIDFPDSSLAD